MMHIRSLALAALLLSYPASGCGDIHVPPDEPQGVTDTRADAAADTTVADTAAPPDTTSGPVSFYAQVRPLIQEPSSGDGIGCHQCHVNNQPVEGSATGGGLYFGGYGPKLHDTLISRSLVNTADPAASLILTTVLAGASDTEHIKPFASDDDARYQLILRWITEGAANDSPQTVSFVNDVAPLLQNPSSEGGIGCNNCHVKDVDPLSAMGGLYMGGSPLDLHQQLTRKAPQDNLSADPAACPPTGELYLVNKEGYPERSLLLANPSESEDECHPLKVFDAVDGVPMDARYDLIITWIREGFLFDGSL